MEIVFLNRFERAAGPADAERGQVFIGEDQGIWTAGWHRLSDDGEKAEEPWFEGTSWEELLASFRFGIARKMREGFRPMLDGMLEEVPFWERRPPLPSMLQCYADQFDAEKELAPLRAWRRAKSAEEKRSAYLVATNRELQMVAVYVPKTEEELKQIPGFGKTKVEKYGKELLQLVGDLPREHAFPLDWVAAAVADETYSDWAFRQKEERFGKQQSLVQEKKRLLSGIRQGRSLAELEKELSLTRRLLIERVDRLDEEGYDVLPLVERELSELPPEEVLEAEQAMNEIGDQFLKPLYQRLYAASGETERSYEKLRMLRIRFRRAGKSAV
ncbi:HRDC domain-containing protein [Cohnella zeiphila]|uniref:HRDC domain-containing protein n=1 Tax=Cohnella zeiphila TaxID=2761120 RepID=A0A7X0VWP7_9BACL|nr:HRDC domain-containing protein [Cohnella zeiphila]MBB6731138.1 HRDC domain-containing protein [Cohnella zeiphila]